MRPIDADELLERSWRWAINSREAVQQMIKGCPTIDAVPVIRCKDCKFSSPNRVYGCRIHSFADDIDKRLYADDFCSMAERKDNG